MSFMAINTWAVILAAVAGFAFGAVWYGVLGKPWMAALGKSAESFKPASGTFILAFFSQLVMAAMLAGVIGHLGVSDISGSLLAVFLLWLGFVVTTLMVNHRFQQASWSLTIIDAGHWLGVMLAMAVVISLFG
jgi:hypothetical protein